MLVFLPYRVKGESCRDVASDVVDELVSHQDVSDGVDVVSDVLVLPH